jgi:hypothetical protein
MKTFAKFAVASLLALSPALALAQVTLPTVATINQADLFQDIPYGQPGPTNYYATGLQMRGYILGGNVVRTSEKPTLTSCVAGGGTIVGTDAAFILTGGSSASTTCTATFTTAWAATPICVVSSQTAPGTTTPSFTVSTSAVVITQASGSSNVYDVQCIGQPGG